MKEQCFDESTIQSFLDGELSSDLLENVARHVAMCDNCALLLQEAEAESAFAFEILGEEFDALVPTERIRANVYQAISQLEQPKTSLWQRFLAFTSSLANPTVAAFASLVIVVGIFAVVLSLKNQNPDDGKYILATNSVQRDQTITPRPIQSPTSPDDVIEKLPTPQNRGVERVVYKPEAEVKSQKPKTKNQRPKAGLEPQPESIDGETTYLKTIATLETTVNSKKDNVLRASSRVSYERDMAVINDSIKRMREEVRKNPKNEAAKQILRNSYQNKIELLNSVTERSELMARLD